MKKRCLGSVFLFTVDTMARARIVLRNLCYAVLLLAAAGIAYVFPTWRAGTNHGGQRAVEPFRIAGNLYYVGANDVTSFLLTSPEGHVLIDGGYPGTASLIIASIAKLGFRIRDVKVLLNTHAHFDHAGGLAELQQASGARLWVSEGDADAMASGGASPRNMALMNAIVYLRMARFKPPRIDVRFKDGATVRVGTNVLTAHVTPGHTPGCTSWSFALEDGGRELLAVEQCSLSLVPNALFGKRFDERTRSEFESSFRTLRALPADIFLAPHAKLFGMRRKLRERATTADPAASFIDRSGYLRYIDEAEAQLRKAYAQQ